MDSTKFNNTLIFVNNIYNHNDKKNWRVLPIERIRNKRYFCDTLKELLTYPKEEGGNPFYHSVIYEKFASGDTPVRLYFDYDGVKITNDKTGESLTEEDLNNIYPKTLEEATLFINDCKKLANDYNINFVVGGYHHDNFTFEPLKKLLNSMSLLQPLKNSPKMISFHVIFYDCIVHFSELPKGQKFTVNDYPNIDKYMDKSVYSDNQLFRPCFADKQGNLKKGEKFAKPVGINLPKTLWASHIIQVPGIVKEKEFNKEIKNIFSNTETTKQKKKKQQKTSTKKEFAEYLEGEEQTEETTATDAVDTSSKIYKDIEKILNPIIKFKGHFDICFSIYNMIPNNEFTKYKVNYFHKYYENNYKKVDHNSEDNLEPIFNSEYTHGLCYCLSYIKSQYDKLYDEKYPDDIDKKYRKKDKEYLEKIITIGNIFRYYLHNYDVDNSGANYNKYINKRNNFLKNNEENICLSSFYRKLYIHKILFNYNTKIIFKESESNVYLVDNTDNQLRTLIKKMLGIERFDGKIFNTLREFTTINKPGNNSTDNYNLINLSYFDKPLLDKYTNEDFEKFERIMFGESFKEKNKGEYAKEILYFDIFNKYSKGYNIVKFYFGEGANLKSSEAILNQNILNNIYAYMTQDCFNYTKEQKRTILSAKYVCIEEIPKNQKEFNKVIQELKKNSESGFTNVRGMCENDKMLEIDVRHQLNTNNKALVEKFIQNFSTAEKRRFLICERICENKTNIDYCGQLSRDKIFCQEYAKWIYQKRSTYKFKFDILNENDIIKINNESSLFNDIQENIKEELLQTLERYFIEEAYLNKSDIKTSKKIYVINLIQWLKQYNTYINTIEKRRELSKTEFLEKLDKYLFECLKKTDYYYCCNSFGENIRRKHCRNSYYLEKLPEHLQQTNTEEESVDDIVETI